MEHRAPVADLDDILPREHAVVAEKASHTGLRQQRRDRIDIIVPHRRERHPQCRQPIDLPLVATRFRPFGHCLLLRWMPRSGCMASFMGAIRTSASSGTPARRMPIQHSLLSSMPLGSGARAFAGLGSVAGLDISRARPTAISGDAARRGPQRPTPADRKAIPGIPGAE